MQPSWTNSWFALRVKFRHEKLVSRILSSKGLEQFLPVYRSKRKWADRVKEIDFPLFPGYVFCRFKPEAWIAVVTTPGVVEIVRYGPRFALVDPAEIAALQAQMKLVDRAPEFYRALAPNIIGLLDTHSLKIPSPRVDLSAFRLNKNTERDLRMSGTTILDRKEPAAKVSLRRVTRVTRRAEANLN
jgi:transcription antitermination factor NusG